MLRDIISTSSARIYGLVVGLAVLVITARWLGATGRGEIVGVTTWVGMLATFGTLSIGSSIFNYASACREKDWITRIAGPLVCITVGLTLISYIIVLGLYIITDGEIFTELAVLSLLLGFLQLPFLFWESYGSALLICLQKINTYNINQILGRSAGLVMLVLLLLMDFGVKGALISLLVAQSSVAVLCYKDIAKFVSNPLRPDISVIKVLVTNGLKVHIHSIAVFFVSSINILIVNRYCSLADTAHYQLALQILAMMLIVPQSACQVMYGQTAERGPDYAWLGQRKVVFRIMLLIVALAVVAYFTAPYIIPLFFGNTFNPSVIIFQWMLISLMGMSLATIMAVQWISRGLFWQLSLTTLSIGVLNVTMAFVLVPKMKVYGAVWATVISQSIVFLANIVLLLYCDNRRLKTNCLIKEVAN